MCGGVAELSYLTAASKRWGKNSRASVASFPTLTFFLKKVCCMGSLKLVELGKHIPVFDEAYEIHNMYSKRSLERLSKFN